MYVLNIIFYCKRFLTGIGIIVEDEDNDEDGGLAQNGYKVEEHEPNLLARVILWSQSKYKVE